MRDDSARTSVPGIVAPGMIEIRGRVFDRDGVPVTDAMLEFLSGTGVGISSMGRKLRAASLWDSDASRQMKRARLLW